MKALVLNQGHVGPPGDSWVSQLGEKRQCFRHPVLTGQGYGSTSNDAEENMQATGLSGRKCHWCRGERACRRRHRWHPWLPSDSLRRQSSPVSPFSLACALSHFSLTWAWTRANFFTSDLQQAASCWITQTQLHSSAFLFTGKPKTPWCILDLNKCVLYKWIRIWRPTREAQGELDCAQHRVENLCLV